MTNTARGRKTRIPEGKWTTGINLETFQNIGSKPDEIVESAILAPGIENLIKRAEGGDTAAAKEVLALASSYLIEDVFGPMPPTLRRYLANALAKASLGELADVTLHLKRGGRPRQELRTKLRIAHLIHTLRSDDNSLEQACIDVEELIEGKIKAYGKFYGYTKAPNSKTLEGIYCKVLPVIDKIYEEITLKT
jgi:hypothetical protein